MSVGMSIELYLMHEHAAFTKYDNRWKEMNSAWMCWRYKYLYVAEQKNGKLKAM